jgi:dGTP triphosphohydrolase
MMVDSDIDNPSYQVARSQNEANKNQVAVNEITDIFIAKWNNVQDTVMDNLGIITKKAYDFILDNSKIYSLIKETVFDTKSSAIANHIANFIKDVKTDETIPDYSNVREMIKFDKDELKIHLVNHFSHHDKTLVAYDVYDVLVEIYSTLDYTTKRLDILPDASHIAKAGIKTLNVLLNHAYISFFKEVVSVVYEDESAKTKEEAIELLNKMVSRKFGSTYEPVTQEQIDQIT